MAQLNDQMLKYYSGAGDSPTTDFSFSVGTPTSGINTRSFIYGFDGAGWISLRSELLDDARNPSNGQVAYTSNMMFNDTNGTWERQRSNLDLTTLTSAARTATTNSADITNHNAKGVSVIIDVTSITDTPSITVDIEAKDPISGNYVSLLTSAAITTVSTNLLQVYPGIAEVANTTASRVLPRTFRVTVTHADADSITYSVSSSLIL